MYTADLKKLLYLSSFLLFSPPVMGVDAPSSVDCSAVEVDFVDHPDMTREERLWAMNQALFDSIDRFEDCTFSIKTNSQAPSTAQDNMGGALQGGSGAEGDSDNTAMTEDIESVANPTMAGTEESVSDNFLVDESVDEPAGLVKSDIILLETSAQDANGKSPEEIPAVNNNDVLAAQIRRAAEIETDPEKKEKLWDEYRKYKRQTAAN